MYIENKIWDDIVSSALEIVEFLESPESSPFIPKKNELLSILYSLIHLESSTSPIEEMEQATAIIENVLNSLKNK